MKENWENALKAIRQASKSCIDSNISTDESASCSSREVDETILSLCDLHFPEISRLLDEYNSSVKSSQTGMEAECTEGTDDISQSSSRHQVVPAADIYSALRFIMAALSCPRSRTTREQLQLLAVVTTAKPPLHQSLSCLISLKNTHKKIRILSSKILCNLGTCNHQTAKVLLRDIRPSPTEQERIEIMLGKLSCRGINDSEKRLSDSTATSVTSSTNASTWSQMIYACGGSGDRESLAAVVAALYNTISSIQNCCRSDEYLRHISSVLSSDYMMMSNLIRYILPSQVVQPATKNKDSKADDLSDDATEWITRLMEKFFVMGYFPNMYTSLAGECDQKGSFDSPCGILPEQLVLLHCICSCLEDSKTDVLHPLLDDGLPSERVFESITKSFQFFAMLYCNLRKRFHSNQDTCPRNDSFQERFDGENSCVENGANVILDILSSSLSVDHRTTSQFDWNLLRQELGQSSNMVQVLVLELGMLLDRLGLDNRGINARELKIQESDQHHVTSIVRLIGNLCYKCRINQDLVRTTIVPIPKSASTHGTIQEYTQLPKDADMSSDDVRNGLHVLLSCTSFAYGCFTLREWAIVAIRNVLEDNIENQTHVEKLEAQQALNTPELEKLGIDVHLDQRGNVQVSAANTVTKNSTS